MKAFIPWFFIVASFCALVVVFGLKWVGGVVLCSWVVVEALKRWKFPD